MHQRGRKLFLASVVGALTITLAACGSRLSPEEVRAASGGGAVGGPDQGALGGVPGGDSGTLPDGSAAGAGGASGTTGGGTGSTAGGTAGGATGTTGGSGGSASVGTGANAAGGKAPKGSCAGLKNQTGVTDKTITIANVADVSGPIPGLFASAQEATKAYVEYFNASSDICGRSLKLIALDSRTDAGADQQAYAQACESAFAAVGSMSAFDSGGAGTAEDCGLPDIRSASVTVERTECATCFGAQSTNSSQFENAVPDYFVKNYKAASQKAAYVWINAGAGPLNANNQADAMEKRGMDFIYRQAIDVSEFNYAPYVQQMKSDGVRYVQFLGAYQQAVRLAQAMQQQGFKPDAFVLDPTGYDPRYVESGGDAVEGTKIFINMALFEEMQSNKEMQLYNAWLQQVKPGATPTFFGVFAWSAARLLVEKSIALGGRLSRANLITEIKGVKDWTSNGIHSTQQVGAKQVGDCWRFIALKDGEWVPEGPTDYMCNGITEVG